MCLAMLVLSTSCIVPGPFKGVVVPWPGRNAGPRPRADALDHQCANIPNNRPNACVCRRGYNMVSILRHITLDDQETREE